MNIATCKSLGWWFVLLLWVVGIPSPAISSDVIGVSFDQTAACGHRPYFLSWRSGMAQLGGRCIAARNLDDYETELRQIGTKLTPDGDFKLYGRPKQYNMMRYK